MKDDELYKRNVENFARRYTAQKMDPQEDPWGLNLPDEIWRQGIPQAERRMAFDVENRTNCYNHVTVSGTCPNDATVEEVKEYFYHDYFGGRGAWVKDGRFGCTIHTD